MTTDLYVQQRKEWAILYERTHEVLRKFGEEDDGGKRKDYLLVDDNLGLWQQRVETSNLKMVCPAVVKLLQELLIGYPNWEIVIALGRFGGIVIRDDEIVDDLRRENLPEEFQAKYEGSRPQGSRFGDIMYSGSDPAST
jgi:hypothetical protein